MFTTMLNFSNNPIHKYRMMKTFPQRIIVDLEDLFENISEYAEYTLIDY